MYRVLVVDDEEIITDSLVRLLKRSMNDALDVYPAYSGYQALDLLGRAGFDVVITDIQMPGLTGVELLKQIHALYPTCRVIFLSGHDEFEYAYQALQYHAARYVLKNEGDDVLLEALRDCLQDIDRDAHQEELIASARRQLAQSMPILKREYLSELLTGALPDRERLEADFGRLGVGLSLDKPLFLLAARLDGAGGFEELFGVDALVRERLEYATLCEMAAAKPHFMLWLMQSKSEAGEGVTRVRGMADMLQRTCAQTLGFSVSFVLDVNATPWQLLQQRSSAIYHAMICLLDRGEQQAFVYFDGSLGNELTASARERESLASVRQALEACDTAALDAAFSALMVSLAPAIERDDASLLLVVSRLNAMLMSFLEDRELLAVIQRDYVMRAFLEQPMAGDRRQQLERFPVLCARACAADAENRRSRQDKLVLLVNEYIEAHLGEELSLVTLSEHTFLNPSYLSRRYKELTGRNLSDVVTQARMARACELLRNPAQKVGQIALTVGYTSATHFSRVFRHAMNQTPQEWRERHAQGSSPCKW